MASWYQNKLTITGSPKYIKAIKRRMVLVNPKCTDETSLEYAFFDFNGMVKMPKKKLLTSDDYDEWTKQNWGSHSNACNTRMISSLEQDADLLSVRFDTIGSFPHLVIQKLIEHYPDCTFAFYYYGLDLCSAGEIHSTQYGQSISCHYVEATDMVVIKNIVWTHFGNEIGV